jgi:hypothetical protein
MTTKRCTVFNPWARDTEVAANLFLSVLSQRAFGDMPKAFCFMAQDALQFQFQVFILG